MAQRIVYRLEDDLDSSEAAETIVFGIDSVSYEIDLSEGNAQSCATCSHRTWPRPAGSEAAARPPDVPAEPAEARPARSACGQPTTATRSRLAGASRQRCARPTTGRTADPEYGERLRNFRSRSPSAYPEQNLDPLG